jgi:hypothetical protein
MTTFPFPDYPQFPLSVMPPILELLESSDVANCALLNKTWKKITEEEFALRAQKLLTEHIDSNEFLIERFGTFIKKCSYEKNCRFKCILGEGRGSKHITIEIINSNNPPRYHLNAACVANENILSQPTIQPPSQFHSILIWEDYDLLHHYEPSYKDPKKPSVTDYTEILIHPPLKDKVTVTVLFPYSNPRPEVINTILSIIDSKLSLYQINHPPTKPLQQRRPTLCTRPLKSLGLIVICMAAIAIISSLQSK